MSQKKNVLLIINSKNNKIYHNKVFSNNIFVLNLIGHKDLNQNLKNIKNIDWDNDIDKIYKNNYDDFKRIFKEFIDLDYQIIKTRFFDLNFSDSIWKKYIEIKLINNIIKSYSIDEIIISKYDYDLISNIENNKQLIKVNSIFKYYLRLKKIININFFYIILFSYNLLNELLYSFYFYSKKKKNNRNIKSIVFGTYPNNWIFKNNVISYRYTGPHFQFKDKSEKYIVSLTRCNQEKSKNFFKNLKYFSLLNKYNILPMESCTNPYDVFKSYFFSLIKINQNFKKINFKKVNLESYKYELLYRYIFIERPKNLLINKQIINILNYFKNTKNCIIPMHELYEQRIIINSLKKIKNVNIYGIQQGAIGLCHLWRFVYSQSFLSLYKNNFLPNLIFIEGEITKKYFEKYNIKNYKVIGAQRVLSLPNIYTYDKRLINKYLILLDMHNWKKNLKKFLTIIKNNSDIKFIIKPHPAREKKYASFLSKIKFKFSNLESNFSNLNIILNENYNYKIFANETGAVIELAKNGWPCFIFKDKNNPSANPLALADLNIYYNYDEIEKIFQLKYNELEIYRKNLLQISSLFFNLHGKNSTIKMKKIIDEKSR